jgi:hypothetical protein
MKKETSKKTGISIITIAIIGLVIYFLLIKPKSTQASTVSANTGGTSGTPTSGGTSGTPTSGGTSGAPASGGTIDTDGGTSTTDIGSNVDIASNTLRSGDEAAYALWLQQGGVGTFEEFTRIPESQLPVDVATLVRQAITDAKVAEWQGYASNPTNPSAPLMTTEQAIQKIAAGESLNLPTYDPTYPAVVALAQAKIAAGGEVVIPTSFQSWYTFTTPEGLQAYLDDPASYAGKYGYEGMT